jgi:hypothetical protein
VNKIFLFVIFIAFLFDLKAITCKSIEALNISKPLIIDGNLDEPAYKDAIPARDFVQIEPYNGKPSLQNSEVYFFYDNVALYIGAMLYDSAPDSIFNQFTQRDNIGISDYFGIYIDPYNQGQLAYGFFVNVAGVQTDLKAIKSDYDYEDVNWNAVWESATKVNNNGWVVEMRIPYSAIRFPKKDEHIWGLNIFRSIRRYNSNNSWNFINKEVNGFIHQQGQLTGIKNINPPIRLSISPYGATYFEFGNKNINEKFTYKAGLDLKYGLNESFTLDMMLIPDFGQIQSDDKKLNLSPYELYYDEKRQFFTEGTELFQRGNIFYSRRIGASPKFTNELYNNLKDNEIIDYNPTETRLINASKISGRNNKGWGFGFLNAMTLPAYATIKDTIENKTRKFLLQPFTNYNVSVIDKSLKNNSYISLINGNVYFFDNPFFANVTATQFQFRDKSKTYALSGKAGISFRNDTTHQSGYYSKLAFDKNSGKLQFGISQSVYSDKYNPNDIGYLYRNNYLSTEAYIAYNIVNPFWIIRECYNNIFWNYNRIYNPSDFFSNEIGISTYALFKNNYSMNFSTGFQSTSHDYYETRVKNRYYLSPPDIWANYYVSSDNRKPLTFYISTGGYFKNKIKQYGYWVNTGPSIRIGQRFQLNYKIGINNEINDRGFIEKNDNEDTIVFARRNIKSIENIFSSSYSINNKSTITLRVRHYWSGALNKEYFILQNNGNLSTYDEYNSNKNENFNTLTIDMIVRWVFAPGSELSLAFKSSVFNSDENFTDRFLKNLDNTFTSDINNSISLKILYYIDYNNLKNIF